MSSAPRIAMVLLALGQASCLVIDSPEFSGTTPAPPLLAKVSPPVYQVTSLPRLAVGAPTEYPRQTVRFWVVADKRKGPLKAIALMDFDGFGLLTKTLNFMVESVAEVEPVAFDTTRDPESPPAELSLVFPAGTPPGCHSATLVVSRELSFDRSKVADSATATWWYELEGAVDGQDAGVPCGARTPPAADAATPVP